MTEEELFGFGLVMADGDIVLEPGDAGLMRFRTVQGKRNLIQALTLRILTPFGSDLFNTTYGLDVQQALAEPTGIRAAKQIIQLNLVRTLATDSRVRDVREVLFADDPAYLTKHPELDPNTFVRDLRHKRSWEIEVVLDTVDGQTVTLPVGVAV
jgi:hypothetical protein